MTRFSSSTASTVRASDAKHKNWVDVLSFSWGVSQPHSSSGQFTGHVVPEDFTFTHAVDKSSPKLMLASAEGDAINEVDVSFRKAGSGGGGIDYLKYSFFDVFISSVRPGGQCRRPAAEDRGCASVRGGDVHLREGVDQLPAARQRSQAGRDPIQTALDFENFGDVAGAASKKH